MNLMEFKGELEKLDMPIQYQSFALGQAPELPYLIFYEDDSDNLFADNVNYYNNLNLTCELYSDEKDLELETKVQKLFFDNEIEYNSTETFIDSENMFLKAYSVSIIFDAMADVKEKEIDKSKLQSLIDYVDTLNADLYEQDGFNKLQTSLAYAKASLIDNETTQDEIDESEDELIDCLSKISLIVVEVDRSQLQEQIDYAENLSANRYTQETWALLTFALSSAKKVFDDENSKQADVNSALTSLFKAINGLVKIEGGFEKGVNLYAPLYWFANNYFGDVNSEGVIDREDEYYVLSPKIYIPEFAYSLHLQLQSSNAVYVYLYDKNEKYIGSEFLYGSSLKKDIKKQADYMYIKSIGQTASSLATAKIKLEYNEQTAYTIAPEDEKFNILTQL